jgi:DNA-binding winged helix-turn-helix (wHTH) protein/TolB-like protein
MPGILPEIRRLAYGVGMNGGRVRFGLFEFSPGSGELWRQGVPVKLQAQPGRVLAVLVNAEGQVVSRETLQREVWGVGTHVDFERGLNFCIAQVRSALGDSADSPRFIATVPKQGYRFIAPLEFRDTVPAAAPAEPVKASGRRVPVLLLAAAALALAAIAWPLWGRLTAHPDTVVVIPFYNETGRPELDALARNLSDVTVVRLATPERLPALSVIGNAPSLRHPFARTDVQEIAGRLGAEWVVIGQLKADGTGLRLVGHLIRSGDMKHLWAQTFDDPAFGLAAQERTAETIAARISQALASN